MPKPQLQTRASLILRLQNSEDVDAWDQFAEIYSPVVYRVAINRGLQPVDAENLVQEVFIAVANSVTKWLDREDRGPFRAWLLRIARNKSIDILTRTAKFSDGIGGGRVSQAMADVACEPELSSELDLEYEREVFSWACTQVSNAVASHTWQAFQLTHVEGQSVQEAARLLKTRPGNIYFARSRVMARIKQLVEQYRGDHE
ncbi:MAG: sigma-70 family RNA polymerase sigma factor [Planctomycetota bacterium]